MQASRTKCGLESERIFDMATIPRKGLSFVWVSWITGLIAGSAQCQWAAWFKAHFKYDKIQSDFNLESWSADHDALVQKRVKEFEADGQKVRVENENWMRVPGETALLIGKPDVIASTGAQFTVADGKTGDPHKRDYHQMLLYLYMIRKAWKNPNLRVTGEVFYAAGSRIQVQPEEFDQTKRETAFGVIRMAGHSTPPPRTPSVPECSRCDILDCSDRMSEVMDETPLTAEF